MLLGDTGLLHRRFSPSDSIALPTGQREEEQILELIGKPGYETISTPDATVIMHLRRMIDSGHAGPCVAEVGVGIGATTLEICRVLSRRGRLHLFDFVDKIDNLRQDLDKQGFGNIEYFSNSRRLWDSYNWSLLAILQRVREPIYDYVYLDGAHTYLHDGLAFFLLDRLLKPGGLMHLDDYNWSYAISPTTNPHKNPRILDLLSNEQIEACHIKMIVDIIVRSDQRYEVVEANKVFRKRS